MNAPGGGRRWLRVVAAGSLLVALIGLARECSVDHAHHGTAAPFVAARPSSVSEPGRRVRVARPTEEQQAPEFPPPPTSPVPSASGCEIRLIEGVSGELLSGGSVTLADGSVMESDAGVLRLDAQRLAELRGGWSASAPGFVTETFGAAPDSEPFVVELRRSITLRVRLTDASGVRWIRPARVALARSYLGGHHAVPANGPRFADPARIVETRSGEATFEALRAGQSIRAVALSDSVAGEYIGRVASDGADSIELRMVPVVELNCRAVDAATGEPIPRSDHVLAGSASVSNVDEIRGAGLRSFRDRLALDELRMPGAAPRRFPFVGVGHSIRQCFVQDDARTAVSARVYLSAPGYRAVTTEVPLRPIGDADVPFDVPLQRDQSTGRGAIRLSLDTSGGATMPAGRSVVAGFYRVVISSLRPEDRLPYYEVPLQSFDEIDGIKLDGVPAGEYRAELMSSMDYVTDAPGCVLSVNVPDLGEASATFRPLPGGVLRIRATISGHLTREPLSFRFGPPSGAKGAWQVSGAFSGPPYEIGHLKPGTYSISVKSWDRASSQTQFRIEEGVVTPLDLSLEPQK